MKKYISWKIWIPANGREMKLLILQPVGKVQLRTGVLWIHGGGYATGMPKMVYFTRAIDLVVKSGAVVISPDYRLSGKAPYPAALMDCHIALKYMLEHADELGIRSDQLMVGGESAGGGLTEPYVCTKRILEGFGLPSRCLCIQCSMTVIRKARKTITLRFGIPGGIIMRGGYTCVGFLIKRFHVMRRRHDERITPACHRLIPSYLRRNHFIWRRLNMFETSGV